MKRVLAIVGDAWHASAFIIMAVVRKIEARGYESVIVLDNAVPWDDLAAFDMVLISRYGHDDTRNARDFNFKFNAPEQHRWLTADQEELLVKFTEDGGKLFLHHDAIGFSRKDGGIHRLSKAFFHNHPPRIEIEIRPTGALPELTAGVEPYRVIEEEYVVDMDESQTTVFLESHSDTNGRHAQGWCHEWGKGKVMVLIPGHGEYVFDHPMTAKCIENAITWLEA